MNKNMFLFCFLNTTYILIIGSQADTRNNKKYIIYKLFIRNYVREINKYN